MYAAILILILIASVLLILVILAQNSKGGGMSAQFGGSGANQMIGAQNTTNLLEKITWGFATAILVLSLGANFLIDRTQGDIPSSPNVEKAKSRNLPQNIQPNPGSSNSSGEENNNAADQPAEQK
ncbi:MAG: preprotein translocase subunit SecG [Microscillaceae bacterium]|nr:preprotein translocase subunit SecG [Microscillaceae bacterium]